MLARHVLSVRARASILGRLWSSVALNLWCIYIEHVLFKKKNPAITCLQLLIWKRKSAISVVVWVDDEVLGSPVVWLMKLVMWTDLSQLCKTCQCVNSWDMLSRPVTWTTSIYAVGLVRLWRDEARPPWAQKVGQIAIIELILGDRVTFLSILLSVCHEEMLLWRGFLLQFMLLLELKPAWFLAISGFIAMPDWFQVPLRGKFLITRTYNHIKF